MWSNLRLTLVALATVVCVPNQALATGSNSKLEKELQARIDRTYGILWEAQQAEAFVKEAFTREPLTLLENISSPFRTEKILDH
jgi:hypothetical protein